MPADIRPRRRRVFTAALTVALTLLIVGCTQNPNSVFHSRSEFNRDVTWLFSLILWLGTIVFVLVEALLIYTMVKYRHKGVDQQPEQVHGNTRLEILWTVIPAVVLAIIAVPTVRSIFRTEAPAPAGALQVHVIGHQWWWEFRYPEYNVTTANELYLPIGRTVDFTLETHDVLHSFWIPALGGKRDLVNNRKNHLWFTPDSTTEAAFNGFCAEFCGVSHANMRFRAFTVSPAQFSSWIAHQQTPGAGTPATQPAPITPAPAATGRTPARSAVTPPSPAATAPVQAGYMSFARDSMPHHAVPHTPIPPALHIDESLKGDPASGSMLVSRGSCIGCHTIKGVPGMVAQIGPDLTHVGSRLTIGGGLFPNDTRHLTAWIKNSRAMKPGVLMPTQGKGEFDPVVKQTMGVGLTDQQIADVVAYLQTLK